MSSPNFKLYDELMKEGKVLAAEGKLYESLSKFQHARKIHETPKVLQRIQKLKDFIQQQRTSKVRLTSDEVNNSTLKTLLKEKVSNSNVEFERTKSRSIGEHHEVLNEIQNFEIKKPVFKIPTSVNDLSPDESIKFNQLKKKAMEFSYDGKFEAALEVFQQALKLCDCSTVKKYIQDLKAVLGEHPQELQEFQRLADSGKKLVVDGKQSESVEKLKNALEICPSPKVSRIIKHIEEKNSVSFIEDKSMSSTSQVDRLSYTSLSSDTSVSPSFEHTPTDPKCLSPEDRSKFKNLYTSAREDAGEGKLQKALATLKEALKICESDKVKKRIKDLEELIEKSDETETEDGQMIAVADGFHIFHEIYEKLYPYQRTGVSWMWKLFKKRKGGVLGDDMGLGKTFQVIAFLSGLIDADLVQHVLIIMPVSLLTNWENEFKKWCPGIKVYLFHGSSKKERERNVLRVQKRGHVLLTSYGMVVNNIDILDKAEDSRFIWDYVILDEGHKIKNPTKTTKAVHEIPAKNRLVLTGTPIQNNLRELWALYDFVHQGALLGSMKTFKMQYENIITRAREKDATVGEKRLGTEMAENLRKLIQPYFLRRNKDDVWGKKNGNSDVEDIECKMATLEIKEDKKLTTRKNDLIVWLPMAEQQCEIYRSFLQSDAVKSILVSKRSPLVELTTLKKICDHPRLLTQRACLQLGLDGELEEEDLMRELDDESKAVSSIENVSDETLINEAVKMKFLINLLENLKEKGHRTLVFSLSRKILDMIHRILTNRNWKVLRIDGTISKIEERERRIQLFQKNSSYPVFLLTTQVGGVGITLTAADRVVIYDPSWNPATDSQAVDRAYRIGQKNNVVVYRLMTCGTVEEKIYRRQIFKDSITRQATSQNSSDPYRYFSKQELRELFVLENTNYSVTQVQLSQMHSGERKTDVSLDEHIAFLYSLDIFGISDHDLMFSKDIKDNTEDNDEAAISHDYIKKQVAVAQQLIQAEAAVVEEGLRIAGNYSRPYLENIPSFKKPEKDLYKPPSLPEVIDLINNSPIIRNSEHLDFHNEREESNISSFSPAKSSNYLGLKQLSTALSTNKRESSKYKPLFSENKITNYTIAIKREDDTNANSRISSLSYRSDIISTSAIQQDVKIGPKFPSKSNLEISNQLNSTIDIESDDSQIYDSNQDLVITEKSSNENHVEYEDTADIILNKSELSVSQINPESANCTNLNVSDCSNLEEFCLATNVHESTKIEESTIKNIEICENTNPDKNDSIKQFPLSTSENINFKLKKNENYEFIPTEQVLNENTNFDKNDSIKQSYLSSRVSISDSELKKYENGEYIPIEQVLNDSYLKSEEVISNFDNHDKTRSSTDNQKSMSSSFKIDSNSSKPAVFYDSELSYSKNNSLKVNESIEEYNTIVPFSEKEKTLSPGPSLSIENNSSSDLNSVNFTNDDKNLSPNHNLTVENISNRSRLGFVEEKGSLHGSYQDTNTGNVSCSSLRRTSSPISEKGPHTQRDITMFLNESLGEFSEKLVCSAKNKRKSCARLTQCFSESDSSRPVSGSSSINTSQENIVIDSDSDAYDPENSVASISLNESASFVPSSIPSTPLAKLPLHQSRIMSSPMSPRRITPLKLSENFISPSNSPFAKALAKSPLIHIPKEDKTVVNDLSDDSDSPIAVKAKCRRALILDSDEDISDASYLDTSYQKRKTSFSSSSSYEDAVFKTPKSQPNSCRKKANLLTNRVIDSDSESDEFV